jgi:hypothetical protein
VPEELKNGKHGKTTVVQFLVGGLECLFLGSEFLNTSIGGERSGCALGCEGIVYIANEEEHLHPAKSWYSLDGGNSRGNRFKSDSGGNLARELVGLGGDVSKNGKLGNTAVLDLSLTVEVECFLVDILGEALYNQSIAATAVAKAITTKANVKELQVLA